MYYRVFLRKTVNSVVCYDLLRSLYCYFTSPSFFCTYLLESRCLLCKQFITQAQILT